MIGKFLAAAGFVTLLVLLLALFPGILFLYSDPGPEPAKVLSGLAALWMVGVVYVTIGAFASSVTRNQLIAFFLAFVLLRILWMLGFLADLGAAGGAAGSDALGDLLRYLSTAEHFESMVMGLIDTQHLAYFAVLTAAFLVFAKTAVESARWR